MRCSMVSLYIFVGLLLGVQSYYYCSAPNCRPGSHIACGNNRAFGPSCPAQVLVVNMAPLQNLILDAHNSRRNMIAGGGLSGFSPAARMGTTRWHDELAYLALLNVMTCIFAHDECRNTAQFPYSGQNLGVTYWYGSRLNDEDIVQTLMQGWFAEYVYADQSIIDHYHESSRGVIGHLTVMVNERNIYVGCAAVRFYKSPYHTFLFACNYARTNIYGWPIYESALVPASECSTGTNPTYGSLCSVNEVYDF